MNRQVRTPWTISSWPTMTLEISDFTWLYRVRNSSARASIDSEGASDIDGDPFVTLGVVLELYGFSRPEPEFLLAPSPLAGEGWGEGGWARPTALSERSSWLVRPLSLPSPARGEGEITNGLP